MSETPSKIYEGLFQRSILALKEATDDISSLDPQTHERQLDEILSFRGSSGLDVDKSAFLIASIFSERRERSIKRIENSAKNLRERLFANKVATMAPIELTSFCASHCRFCGWNVRNGTMPRSQISKKALLRQATTLFEQGIYHIELVGGDDLPFLRDHLEEYLIALKKLAEQLNVPARFSLCFTPFTKDLYRRFFKLGIHSVLTWQETYDRETFEKQVTAGPKAKGISSDFKILQRSDGFINRLQSQEIALSEGLQVGLGAMLGLSEQINAEILSVILHGHHLLSLYPNSKPLIIGMPILNNLTIDSSELPIEKIDLTDIFCAIASIYLLSFPDRKAWVFANCRVPLSIQTKTVAYASAFSSTMVRLGPGGYLQPEQLQSETDFFLRSTSKLAQPELGHLLEGEQFRHYYHSHNQYLNGFASFGIKPVPEDHL